MNIYIGNLSFDLTEGELRQAFEEFGEVGDVKIITDRYSGRSKGFGFVDMPNDEEARTAISGMDGKELKGRSVKVNEARPRADRPERSSSGSFGRNRRY